LCHALFFAFILRSFRRRFCLNLGRLFSEDFVRRPMGRVYTRDLAL
jgi:hypothetical protein